MFFAKVRIFKYAFPTADFRVVTEEAGAMEYLLSCPLPVVVKADGLALGKGVLIAETREAAVSAVETIMLDRELVGIDEEAENAHIHEAAKKLWGDLNHRKY